MYEKMDGASGFNGEANVEVPVTYVLWFDHQTPVTVVVKNDWLYKTSLNVFCLQVGSDVYF